MSQEIEMEELLLTWSLQHSSVRHLTLEERHHKEASFPLITAAYQAITGSIA